MEYAHIFPNPATPPQEDLRGSFLLIFASLDERPRTLFVTIHPFADFDGCVSVRMESGEPVFIAQSAAGIISVRGAFSRRWIAEHPSPLVIPVRRTLTLVLDPDPDPGSSRIKVRPPTLVERLAAAAFHRFGR